MAMVIPNEGKTLLLELMLRDDGTLHEGMSLSLYSNDYTPVAASTLASFTEATFTGYAPVGIARADFGAANIVDDRAYIQTEDPPEFTCTGGSAQTVYGWYLHGLTSGKVYAAQRFATPRNMASGATESIDPFKIALDTLTG